MPQAEHVDRDTDALLDLTPLRHPAWWLALALLLVNDNLLKGGGIVPGWLTGKLSDFAFLVVAPVLLSALLPVRLVGRRVIAFSLVVGVYAAADLSPAASDVIVALAAKLGLHWRLWPDVTDLLALLVLPGSWWLAGRRRAFVLRTHRPLLETAGVIVGAMACLATSDIPHYDHFPFLVNQTDAPRTVTFTWLLKKASCDTNLPTLAQTLTADDLAESHQETLASGQVAALDQAPSSQTLLAGKCQTLTNAASPTGYISPSTTQNCTATIVSVAGGPAVLVSAPRLWQESADSSLFSCGTPPEPKSTCEPTMAIAAPPGKDALSLQMVNGTLVFKANQNVRMVEVDLAAILSRPGDGTGCKSQRDQLNALLDTAKNCTADSDCIVLQASFNIPTQPLCNAYVNRTLSYGTLAARASLWKDRCQTSTNFSCSTDPVQPPVCRTGKCEEACPGISLATCYDICSTMGFTAGAPCSGAATGGPCFTADGQQGICLDGSTTDYTCYSAEGQACACPGSTRILYCEAPRPRSETCPLTCAAYYPIGATDRNIVPLEVGAIPPRRDATTGDVDADTPGTGVDSGAADTDSP